ncbi:hypothetical protein M565_ctg1P1222 [Vibrio cyclitrophicus FF75]|nr:hypothetical protein M565_ctg1P1222 [Vibrio cyclitrophicus FF75]
MRETVELITMNFEFSIYYYDLGLQGLEIVDQQALQSFIDSYE